MVTTKRIAPAAMNDLKEALTNIYWYKSDLRSFIMNTISDTNLLAKLDWNDYKRNMVTWLVNYLARNQDTHQNDLLRLMSEVNKIEDFSHLSRLEDGAVLSYNESKWQRSSVVEQRTHKPLVVGSNPSAAISLSTHPHVVEQSPIAHLLSSGLPCILRELHCQHSPHG